MLYGITTSKRLSNNINENFYPVDYSNNLSWIYESMHSFGAADFLHVALTDFKNIVSEEIESELKYSRKKSCVFLINRNETRFLDNIDYDYYLQIPEVIEYQTSVNWCNDLTISAAVFVANSKEEAKQMHKNTFGNMTLFNCICVRNSAYICLFTLAYIDGEIVNLYEDYIHLEEGIYHELMHKYVKYADRSLKSLAGRRSASRFLVNVLKILNSYKDDSFLSNIGNIAYVLYALSESEMAAYLAQNKERFNDERINSVNDFYKLLRTSVGYKIIRVSNKVISFIDAYDVNNYKVTPSVKKFLAKVNEPFSEDKDKIKDIDELLKILVADWKCNSLISFKKKLIKKVDIFKHKLYNIAYDSVPDSIKHKLNTDYFTI